MLTRLCIAAQVYLAQTQQEQIEKIRKLLADANLLTQLAVFAVTAMLLLAAYSIAKHGLRLTPRRRIQRRAALLIALTVFLAACVAVVIGILLPYFLPTGFELSPRAS
jgi:VIT1/CCC1 family predicted Fe2+/Mn2+ transporter